MTLPLRSSTIFLAAALALASCGKPSQESAAGTPAESPDAAVMAWVQALQKDDLAALVKSATSDAELAKLRAEWSSKMSETPPEEGRAQFAASMAMLTGEGAEDALMAKVEPELAKMKPQVDMLLGMAEGMAGNALASSESLSAEEQEQGRVAVQALVNTLRQNDVTDPTRARKAVGIVCKTARKLELKTVEDVQKLSFDRALERGNHLLAGAKELLEVYGFSTEILLASVKARTVSQTGDKATVEVSYTLLGTERRQNTEMVRVDGRWVVQREKAQELQSGIGG
jgi:hypothetical protein